MWLLRNCSKTLSMKNVSFMRHTLNGHLGDAVQITGIVGPRKFSFTSQLNKAMRDYYAVLQVSRSALQKDIKEAYDLLSKRYVRELERDNDSKEATEKLLSITEAYEVLGNIGRRRMYDKGLYSIIRMMYGKCNRNFNFYLRFNCNISSSTAYSFRCF